MPKKSEDVKQILNVQKGQKHHRAYKDTGIKTSLGLSEAWGQRTENPEQRGRRWAQWEEEGKREGLLLRLDVVSGLGSVCILLPPGGGWWKLAPWMLEQQC